MNGSPSRNPASSGAGKAAKLIKLSSKPSKNSSPFTERFFKQPKALPLLFLVQMWECFSFFGMRALLVLYMIDGLYFSEVQAFGIYAVYTAMVEVCVLLGGFLADKVWGLRRCIFFGGLLITMGHLCLALTEDFFLGLSFIIVGSSLFKSNVKALLGTFYGENDPRREAGFTLFYSGMNLGGLLAATACGFVGHYLGWHAGFGLAAIGMIIGLITLTARKDLLEDKGYPLTTRSAWIHVSAFLFVVGLIPVITVLLQQSNTTMLLLPLIGVGALVYLFCQRLVTRPILMLLGMIAMLMFYFAFEEMMCSLLMVFANKYVQTSIPASVLVVMNPLAIILLGPVIARLQLRYKIPLAFLCLTAAFFLLFVGAQFAAVPVAFLLASFAIIALGELFIAPVVYAESTKIPHLRGIMTSFVAMGFAYGSLLSGAISQYIAPVTLADYSHFFLIVTVLLLVMTIAFRGISLARAR